MSTTTTTTTSTAPKTTTLVGMLPGVTPAAAAAAAAPGSENHCEKGFMSQGHYQSPEDAQRRIKELESQVQFFKVQTSGAGENFLFLFCSLGNHDSSIKTNRNSRKTGRVRRGNPPSAIPNKRRLHPPNVSILRSVQRNRKVAITYSTSQVQRQRYTAGSTGAATAPTKPKPPVHPDLFPALRPSSQCHTPRAAATSSAVVSPSPDCPSTPRPRSGRNHAAAECAQSRTEVAQGSREPIIAGEY